jgi:hypothetical protein
MHAVWASKRVWLPFAAAVLCLTVSGFTGSIITAVLVITAFGFTLDGATIMWSRAGHMSEYRQ